MIARWTTHHALTAAHNNSRVGETANLLVIFLKWHCVECRKMGSFPRWIFAALLTTLFSSMVMAFAPGYVFLFFCGTMVLQLHWG